MVTWTPSATALDQLGSSTGLAIDEPRPQAPSWTSLDPERDDTDAHMQVFFGAGGRIDHVGLCVEAACSTMDAPLRYMHSSGKTHGRDGIAVDYLRIEGADAVGAHYARRFVSIGRVVAHRPITALHLQAATRGFEGSANADVQNQSKQ